MIFLNNLSIEKLITNLIFTTNVMKKEMKFYWILFHKHRTFEFKISFLFKFTWDEAERVLKPNLCPILFKILIFFFKFKILNREAWIHPFTSFFGRWNLTRKCRVFSANFFKLIS